MTVFKHSLLIFLMCWHAIVLSADNKTISVGVAHFPPYSIDDLDEITGAEVDIVKESLAIMGYQVNFVSYPYGRLPIAFSTREVDCTIVTQKNFSEISVYYSDIVLPEYQTVAVHLKKNNFDINSINDLKAKSIIAHQRAHLFYGEEYKSIADKNKDTGLYQETARQETQVRMMFLGRIDVIVLAHEIFLYFQERADYQQKNRDYQVSKIFGDKFGFYNAFWDQAVRDDFNVGLEKIKVNGTYQAILERHLKNYSTTDVLQTVPASSQ
ncbi:substrate-binding periplasmic protein [Thalassotalea loyana]|nr:transporter substrate-binding domain-containing protein [Thalassotalea loyana]